LFIAVLSDIYIGNQQHNTELWEIYITNLLVKALQRGDGIGPNQSVHRRSLNRFMRMLFNLRKQKDVVELPTSDAESVASYPEVDDTRLNGAEVYASEDGTFCGIESCNLL
jgi:hypothetical protein